MTVREVELGRELQHMLRIEEHSSIDNEAGAVVWDCALVIANYFHHAVSWACGDMVKGKRVVELGGYQPNSLPKKGFCMLLSDTMYPFPCSVNGRIRMASQCSLMRFCLKSS